MELLFYYYYYIDSPIFDICQIVVCHFPTYYMKNK